MNIEQQVQQEIDEFGELAHERFILTAHHFGEQNKNNDTLLHILEHDKYLQHHDIKLKPLPELFARDVSFYGANAYLMYEHDFLNVGWGNLLDNDECAIVINSDKTRRKTSSALPFDLERAIAGDVVEICNEYGDWSICTSKTFENRKFPLIQLDHVSVSEFNLRHKYPKAAK